MCVCCCNMCMNVDATATACAVYATQSHVACHHMCVCATITRIACARHVTHTPTHPQVTCHVTMCACGSMPPPLLQLTHMWHATTCVCVLPQHVHVCLCHNNCCAIYATHTHMWHATTCVCVLPKHVHVCLCNHHCMCCLWHHHTCCMSDVGPKNQLRVYGLKPYAHVRDRAKSERCSCVCISKSNAPLNEHLW